jgi:hypothetical protein
LSVRVGGLIGMSRYRLQPSSAREQALMEHCGRARYVWNLEQHRHWTPGRRSAPGFAEQCRQLTEARAEFEWLRGGSIIVQQQALKDFGQAMANFFGKTHRRPTWRKRGQGEGFRIVAVKPGDLRRPRSAKGTFEAPGRNVRQKAGLNRGILANGCGLLVERLEHKAPSRVQKTNPRYTSQTRNSCGHCATGSRKSQSRFRCVACGHQAHADVNAAKNLRDTAVGHTVAARGGTGLPEPVNREPQRDLLPVG